jgi:hypothetical protein
MVRRGVTVHFLFAAADPGNTMLNEQAGNAVERLATDGKLTIRVIDGPDHTFTPRWTHRALFDALVEALR